MNDKIKEPCRPMVLPRCWNEGAESEAGFTPRRTMFEIKRRILKKISSRLDRNGHDPLRDYLCRGKNEIHHELALRKHMVV